MSQVPPRPDPASRHPGRQDAQVPRPLPGSREEPLPAHWDELPWPRPTPAAVLTVLTWAVRPPVRPDPQDVAAPSAGGQGFGRPGPGRRAVRGGGLRTRPVVPRVPAARSVPAVQVSQLPDYAVIRASTGVAAMSAAEFGDDDAFVTEMWLRSWARRHRSPAVRAWLQAQHPDRPPEVLTGVARELDVCLALAVLDVEVLVVGLQRGWSDEWLVAVQECGFGAAEAVALHARPDAWEVLGTMAALTGGAALPGPSR